MLKPFENNLRIVRLRCCLNLLLRYTGRVLIGTGIIAIIAVLFERLLAVEVLNTLTIWSLLGISLILVITAWFIKLPNRMQASLLLDERLRLKERFSTTLAISNSQSPFAEAACKEAHEKAQYINIHGYFPIRFTKCWGYTAGTWAVAILLILYMPSKDLLGFLRRDEQQQQNQQQIQAAQTDVNEATKAIALAVQELDNPELAEALSNINTAPENAKAVEIKRQAISRLGDLSDQIKKMQNSVELESAKMMRQMFKQLKGSTNPLIQKLQLAMAQGDFSQASAMLNQLQKDLGQNKLSEQQQKALSEQLQRLAQQLNELAQKNEEFEKELEELSLDKKLAKLNSEELRKSLQQQGLDADKIEELMRKAAASQMARSQMSSLANAMASAGMGAGGLNANGLAGAMEQLDSLEALQQQMMLTEASLAEIARAIDSLGQGMGQGIGMGQGTGPFFEGDSLYSGLGTGGPGQGFGPRSMDESGQTGTTAEREKNQPNQGPTIASWYIKESQIRGEATREYSEVIQAGRDVASEAISDNEIPRKYEDSIKKYFSQLDQIAPTDPNSSEAQE